ncbi:hypothetical protein [Candidatus Trichorickettsia mobilis]|uniref:hypothetical protein n=1 Tax=Candidatus Trichorickettsia mobilis TaxID=1346319 RepID=UPI002B25B41F|nr:hypothetical protein [Candidatus Trichorickettsia mobilis]
MNNSKISCDVENALLNLIIKMLEQNIGLQLISMTTGKSVDEVNRIKLLLQ